MDTYSKQFLPALYNLRIVSWAHLTLLDLRLESIFVARDRRDVLYRGSRPLPPLTGCSWMFDYESVVIQRFAISVAHGHISTSSSAMRPIIPKDLLYTCSSRANCPRNVRYPPMYPRWEDQCRAFGYECWMISGRT